MSGGPSPLFSTIACCRCPLSRSRSRAARADIGQLHSHRSQHHRDAAALGNVARSLERRRSAGRRTRGQGRQAVAASSQHRRPAFFGTLDASNHALTGLDRDRPLHKIHEDQRNHRRCNNDVADPVEMEQRTIRLLRDDARRRGPSRGLRRAAERRADRVERAALVGSGIADISACNGIMREKMPTNSSDVDQDHDRQRRRGRDGCRSAP